MSELERVNDLVGFTDSGGDGANRIFQGDMSDAGVEEEANEVQRVQGKLGIAQAASSPVHAGGGEIGAGRKGDQDVPRLRKQIPYVAGMVLTWGI